MIRRAARILTAIFTRTRSTIRNNLSII